MYALSSWKLGSRNFRCKEESGTVLDAQSGEAIELGVLPTAHALHSSPAALITRGKASATFTEIHFYQCLPSLLLLFPLQSSGCSFCS